MNKMKEMIKQAMKNEITLEDILQVVEDARAEVEEESLRINLDTARKNIISAALDYMVALRILPASRKFSAEDIITVENELKSIEPELKAQANMIKMMMPIPINKEKTV